eukprot:TRINITY_DN2507_c0_g1_i16.p1 TRINITY_DN2507_c0_g1~~TRINITY_DN2507_c0_g1_i16.p1  ORF type:complete len:125 (-),score=31.86 TRINITY_DN2507_c0_g1_i16:463-837(-)
MLLSLTLYTIAVTTTTDITLTCTRIKVGDYPSKLRVEDLEREKQSNTRLCTVILQLAPPVQGGEIFFNKIGSTVPLELGLAILVWHVNPDGTIDPSSTFESLPVLEGTKWSLIKTIRVKKLSIY